jgi:hypothetical protein
MHIEVFRHALQLRRISAAQAATRAKPQGLFRACPHGRRVLEHSDFGRSRLAAGAGERRLFTLKAQAHRDQEKSTPMTTTPGSGGGQPAMPEKITASKRASTSATDTDWAPADHLTNTKPEVQQLREEIKHTRQDLGDTVDALAAKADVKARAQEQARRARTTAQQRMRTAKARAGELRARGYDIAADPDNAAKVKGGTAAAAGSAAVTALIWARRRHNARPATRWDRTRFAARRTAAQARSRGSALLASAAAEQAMTKARQAAVAPDAKPRAQGAATAVGAMLVLVILRRAARRMPAGV